MLFYTLWTTTQAIWFRQTFMYIYIRKQKSAFLLLFFALIWFHPVFWETGKRHTKLLNTINIATSIYCYSKAETFSMCVDTRYMIFWLLLWKTLLLEMEAYSKKIKLYAWKKVTMISNTTGGNDRMHQGKWWNEY